jgi:hypothetical protein
MMPYVSRTNANHCVLMTLGLLELVVPLKSEDFSLRHVWAYMPVLYLLGLALAWRRYK